MPTDDLRSRLARLRLVIEGLRATCGAMTPGPWTAGHMDGEDSVEPSICQLRARACMDVREAQSHACRCPADAKGIAESRTWLPRLLSLAEARLQEADFHLRESERSSSPEHRDYYAAWAGHFIIELERCLLPEEPKP
jgi:hypothetical protein